MQNAVKFNAFTCYTYTVSLLPLEYEPQHKFRCFSIQILQIVTDVMLNICTNSSESFNSTIIQKLPFPCMSACLILSHCAKARAAMPDNKVTVCVVVRLLALLLLCPAGCLQAEWARRMSRSLATCEHGPPLLPDLTPNSFEERGKGGTEETS